MSQFTTHKSRFTSAPNKLLANTLTLLALSGLAVAMPLLDLFGGNPQFFIAKDHRTVEIVVFALALAFIVPLLALAVEGGAAYLMGERLGRTVHAALVFGFGVLFALAVLRKLPLEADILIAGIALLMGGLILFAERRLKPIRWGLRYLAVTPLVTLVIFLFFSAAARLIWAEEAKAASIPGIGNPAPVVILAFDEFPVASLLREDGTINAARFPNFARLAGSSYWFRNGSSVVPWTGGSLTTALTGRMFEGHAPNSIDYPKNLFTLLGVYEMRVHEEITGLCPHSLCDTPLESHENAPRLERKTAWDRLHSSLLDAAVVYAHATLPPGLRAGLPPVSQSLGGFLGQDVENPISQPERDTPPEVEPPHVGEPPPEMPPEEPRERGPAGMTAHAQGRIVRDFIATIQPSADPTLYFTHVVLPHFPWEMTPTGRTYVPDARVYDDLGAIPGLLEGDHWGENAFLVRQGFQRHLLQVGYVDGLIGELIDHLQAAGLWEQAVVVVIADHGVSFIPGLPRRGPTPETLANIYRVPFFIKLPGQTDGVIRDDNAMLIDLLPSLVDVLEVETDWAFEGRSLFGDTPPPPEKRVMEAPGGVIPASVESLFALARRNATDFPHREDWFGVAAVGEFGHLVGARVDELGGEWRPAPGWEIDQAAALAQVNFSSGYAPILITGRLVVPPGTAPREALVALNGVVAGIAGGFDCRGEICQFSALLAEGALQEGVNMVEILVPQR
ncbi:MAG: sulfatase-like hydrolase/transferase [Anaerolineales bacterium]